MQRRTLLVALTAATASLTTGFSRNATAAPGWWERLMGSKNTENPASPQPLTDADIGAGLKEALRVGAAKAVDLLAVEDGFFGNAEVKIPLPESLNKVRSTLDRFGFGSKFDELELQLNRAAEKAAPAAKTLFVGAIQQLTLEDVRAIYSGGDDAATQYLKSKTATPLGEQMRPSVAKSLSSVGAATTYAAVIDRYNQIPFVPKVEANLTDYVVSKGLAGIFLMLGKEEAAIRKDPLKQTSALLRRVFG
jgi:hypothetical protein